MKKYPKYKDSGIAWIGVIPHHWHIRKINNQFKFNTGFTPPTGNTEFYENGIHDWINISDLKGKYIAESSTKITDLAIAGKLIVPKGSLLYSFKLSVGKMAFTLKDVFTNEAIFSIFPHEDINLNYYYYLLDRILIFNCNENIYGAKILNQELIKASKLIVPPSEEQTLIANYLDEKINGLDSLIFKKESLIGLLFEERNAIINKAITKGINKNIKLKSSGIDWIGDIPAHWKTIPLKYLGSTQNGISEGAEYFGSGFPFLSYGDVYKNMILPELVDGLANSTAKDRQGFSVEKGDIFFTRTSETIEEIGLASTCLKTIDNAVFAGFLIRFRPNKDILFEGFSKYYFRSNVHRTFFIKEMNIVTRASLSQGLLKRLMVLLPDLKEQKEISDFLDYKTLEIDTIISKTEKEIELLKEYKTALISEVVTGKVDVREEVLHD